MFFKQKNQKRCYWLTHVTVNGTEQARFRVWITKEELAELIEYHQYLRSRGTTKDIWTVKPYLPE